jgi:hypothetical protein
LRGGTRAAPGSPRNSKAAQMRPFVLVPQSSSAAGFAAGAGVFDLHPMR